MCTVLLPPGENPIAVDKYINTSIICSWEHLEHTVHMTKYTSCAYQADRWSLYSSKQFTKTI